MKQQNLMFKPDTEGTDTDTRTLLIERLRNFSGYGVLIANCYPEIIVVRSLVRRSQKDYSNHGLKGHPKSRGKLAVLATRDAITLLSNPDVQVTIVGNNQLDAIFPASLAEPGGAIRISPLPEHLIASLPIHRSPQRTESQVIERITAVLQQYNLTQWKASIDNAESRVGVCSYTTQTVSLARRLALYANDDEIEETIAHEVAHALEPGAGHGTRWKARMHAMGFVPSRTYQPSEDEWIVRMMSNKSAFVLAYIEDDRLWIGRLYARRPRQAPEVMAIKGAARSAHQCRYYKAIDIAAALDAGTLRLIQS